MILRNKAFTANTGDVVAVVKLDDVFDNVKELKKKIIEDIGIPFSTSERQTLHDRIDEVFGK